MFIALCNLFYGRAMAEILGFVDLLILNNSVGNFHDTNATTNTNDFNSVDGIFISNYCSTGYG